MFKQIHLLSIYVFITLVLIIFSKIMGEAMEQLWKYCLLITVYLYLYFLNIIFKVGFWPFHFHWDTGVSVNLVFLLTLKMSYSKHNFACLGKKNLGSKKVKLSLNHFYKQSLKCISMKKTQLILHLMHLKHISKTSSFQQLNLWILCFPLE